jgi:hypothetical protein
VLLKAPGFSVLRDVGVIVAGALDLLAGGSFSPLKSWRTIL